jgi:group I intron endonuclease
VSNPKIPKGIEKSYFDPINQREEIRKDNNSKIGVYAWENKINNKVYVGSGNPLYLRLSDYYQDWYLNNRNNLPIVRGLNKYSMLNFNLHILEYSNSYDVISCEQKWIDLIKPEYNINPIAGSSKGYKHTDESIEKMRNSAIGRKHSDEVKIRMSETRKGENNSFFNKKHSSETIEVLKHIAQNRKHIPVKGLEVEITDLETNTTNVFSSIRDAAKFLKSDIKTILRRESTQLEKGINIPYRKRYMININRDK